MDGFAASEVKNPIMSMEASSVTDPEDTFEDGCSICLEPFSSDDPATVTTCKHDYHLQCILDWSQRSKECPICWQFLALKDPDSQELLAAVEIERKSRVRQRSSGASMLPRISFEEIEFDHVPPYADDSDFNERLMQHLTAAAVSGTQNFSRRRRSSGLDSPQFLVSGSTSDGSDVEQTYTTRPVGDQYMGNLALPASTSTAAVASSGTCVQPQSIVLNSCLDMGSNITDHRCDPSRSGSPAMQTPPCSPRGSRPSELLSFSEALKSRFSAASAKYKETISKSTRGLKEKLLARNNSVKELSKEVHREVAAGISGVARMMERLDPISKRSGPSGHVSSGAADSSGVSPNGGVLNDDLISQSHTTNSGDNVHVTSSNATAHVSSTLSSAPGHMEVTRVQDVL